jgi:hypothetical protein
MSERHHDQPALVSSIRRDVDELYADFGVSVLRAGMA